MPEVKHVLIIEPNNELRACMASTLESHGYSVMGMDSGKNAMFRIKNQKFSCLVLGLDLGRESIHLIEAIRTGSDQPNHNSPLIVVASALDKELATRLTGKVQGAVITPFAPEAFLARVIRVIA